MTFVPFGSRTVTAIKDNGQNPFNNNGNWTATFSPDILQLPQGQFEVIKGVIAGGSPGASFYVYNDAKQLDKGTLDAFGSASFYRGHDIEFLIGSAKGSGYLYFYFSDPTSDGLAPTITLWLGYDQDLNINAAQFGRQ